MSSQGAAAALPYHEPGIVTILIFSSFLLLLNAINYLLDRIVYCGLIGQILVGVAWGLPGAGWLTQEVQQTVMQLGYLGLILIVYEGGLSTSLPTLKRNLPLSATIALVGIGAPIALSYVLQAILPITALQAFAAGAALCSTSLGTTFTVLSTSGLTESRLGVVLTSAAMMDDVVGLVMVQVISSLGGGGADIAAPTIVRPVLVSLAFGVLVPLFCAYAVRPAARLCKRAFVSTKNEKLKGVATLQKAKFVLDTAVLLAMVTGSTYAGTSNLFAAYLAGAVVSWLDGVLAEAPIIAAPIDSSGLKSAQDHAPAVPSTDTTTADAPSDREPHTSPGTSAKPKAQHEANDRTGIAVYESYYKPAVESILKPFFFASIGFSIPITQMFAGSTVWRGFVYAALMAFGKLLCGLTLVRFGNLPSLRSAVGRKRRGKKASARPKAVRSNRAVGEAQQQPIPLTSTDSSQPHPSAASPTAPDTSTEANTSRKRTPTTTPPAPRSLYPSLMLGSAMVARGEIGFLISSVAESTGVFGPAVHGGSSELFLVVTWAVLICTLLGPMTVGLLVRRVKRLQLAERERERGNGSGRGDPLGAWGVVAGA